MEKLKTLLSYLFVGGTSIIVDATLFFIFFYVLGWPLEVALPVSFLLALVYNFVLNKLWVFGGGHAFSATRQMVLYTLLVILNLGFQYVFIASMSQLGIEPVMSKVVATAMSATWNYFLYRLVIFK